jgi:large subunit ribosomal protein L2
VYIPQIFFSLLELPKLKLISSVEIYPSKGVQYVQSPGSKSLISKIDYKSGLALLKLPSGVHKTFSIYSSAALGSVIFSQRALKTQANAGFFKRKTGKKSLSRGVAKNPVDHPHGGRNKAIKYQRTPWGKTTKYK